MVDWEDHTASAEWEDDVDSCTYEVCRTIGWLIKEDKKSYKIANANEPFIFLKVLSKTSFRFLCFFEKCSRR